MHILAPNFTELPLSISRTAVNETNGGQTTFSTLPMDRAKAAFPDQFYRFVDGSIHFQLPAIIGTRIYFPLYNIELKLIN